VSLVYIGPSIRIRGRAGSGAGGGSALCADPGLDFERPFPERDVVGIWFNHSNYSQFDELPDGIGYEKVGRRITKLTIFDLDSDQTNREGALPYQ